MHFSNFKLTIVNAFLITALLYGLEVVLDVLSTLIFDSQKKYDDFVLFFNIEQILVLIISYVIIFSVFDRSIFNWNKAVKEFKSIKFKYLPYLILLAIGLEFVNRPFFDAGRIYDSVITGKYVPLNYSKQSTDFLVKIIVNGLILVPVFDELFFRKFLLKGLLKNYSLVVSILVSSVCFVLVQIPNYRILIPYFILGILLGLIYVKRKNIFYPIILHFLYNLIWIIKPYYGENYFKWLDSLHFDIVYWLLVILGIIVSYFSLKKIIS